MKRILTASALALTLGAATGASAYTDAPSTLVDQVTAILAANGYGDVDVDTLTDDQISQLYLIGTGSDSQPRAYNDIRGVLVDGPDTVFGTFGGGDDDVTPDAVGQQFRVVQSALDHLGFETSATRLSGAQRAAIYLIATSEDQSQKANRIRAVLN